MRQARHTGGVSQRMVGASAGWLGARTSRRGFLARTAVVGSALVAAPLEFFLRPVSAYAAVCGSGSSCSAGYSAMCCSVNNGVNQCPPGTFAGGWWKADNAGLCGGGPRYYIDCQAECTCSYGCDPFCNSGCWNYPCHCNNDSSTCDNRLVSCNVFRYGQCNQQVACSGPVVCRQISCRPPYHWLPCSSVTATTTTRLTTPLRACPAGTPSRLAITPISVAPPPSWERRWEPHTPSPAVSPRTFWGEECTRAVPASGACTGRSWPTTWPSEARHFDRWPSSHRRVRNARRRGTVQHVSGRCHLLDAGNWGMERARGHLQPLGESGLGNRPQCLSPHRRAGCPRRGGPLQLLPGRRNLLEPGNRAM